MKIILILISLFISSEKILGQSYNTIVSDEQINGFMIQVLTNPENNENAFSSSNKKVYYKPIHIGKANWSISEKSYNNYDFEIRFKKLFHREDLNKNDLTYMKEQYESIKTTKWNFDNKNLILKKKYKKNYFKYSIPIFNKDKNLAIMWRYKYCGSLCAFSEVHIYELKNGRWKIKELIEGWMS